MQQHRDLAAAGITFRPITPADEPFLLHVYGSTREEELAPVRWDNAQKAAFIRMQFDAQHRYYSEVFRDAAFSIILIEGQSAGRLYVNRADGEIHLIDIALLPEYRSGGVGTAILRALQREARETNRTLSIHAEKFNRALHLYERLGFKPVEDAGVYWFMRWSPPADSARAQPKTAS